MAPSVAVLGGGVGGMSAAHELAERGFEVTVFETGALPGGKARSMPFEGTGKDGRPDLPGEHGFRFFPGFYRHLPHTMDRIPVPRGGATALKHLVNADEFQIARVGRRELLAPARFPQSLRDLQAAARFLARYARGSGVRAVDFAHFANRLFVLLTSCEERRFAQFENQSWWEFSGAAQRPEEYQLFLADGLTRSLVAARARELSARTGGYILLQLLFDMSRAGRHVDRLLDGPTNDVWIDPWLTYLRERGVKYHLRHDVQSIRTDRGRVTSVLVASEDGQEEFVADYYVAALPVEQMQMLAGPILCGDDPAMAGVHKLETRWMNGIMFYLDRDVEVAKGHTIFLDSEWSLTAVSQQQFWKVDLEDLGDGRVEGILSVDISEWRRRGRHGKIAMKCSREEIKEDVWAQLEAHLNDDEKKELEAANVLAWFLDPAIRFPNPIEATNLEPLLVNTVGSWRSRPDATPAKRAQLHGRAIENLFLAADYVRTHTDLATMEGANEAARRAVNGIIEASGVNEPHCNVMPLEEPGFFAPARALDRVLFRLGRPPMQLVDVRPDGRVSLAHIPMDVVSRAEGLARRLPFTG
jgi:uncharacterized protein with NAD-binding domain and iron-sulfur cluster